MKADQVNEEVRLRLMQIIETSQQRVTQRDLAREAGISLGKVNYWITEMIRDGVVIAEWILDAGKRSGRRYLLTAKGAEERFHLLIHLLSHKIREYEKLGKEIDHLNQLVKKYSGETPE